MRKLYIGASVAVALLIVVAILPFFIDINKYHDKIESQLQNALHRKVALGRMHLWLLPPSVRVDHIAIGEDPTFQSKQDFASADSVYVRLKFWPLLRGKVEVGALELRQPKVEIASDATGQWNFSSIGKAPSEAALEQAEPNTAPVVPQSAPGAAPTVAAPAGKSSSSLSSLSLDHVAITDGEIAYTDGKNNQPRQVYQHIDLDLRDVSLDKAIAFSLAVHLPGANDPKAKLEGTVGPIGEELMKTPLAATLNLERVPLAAVQQYAKVQVLDGIEVTVSGHAAVTDKDGQISTTGDLHLDDARVHGTAIGYPITANYDLGFDIASKVVDVKQAKIGLGATPLALSGNVNLGAAPMQVDAQLTANNAELAEAARLAAAFGVAFNPGVAVTGRLDANIHATGALPIPAMSGTVMATNLQASGKELPKPVNAGPIELTITPDSIQSNQFTASSGGATVMARVAVSQYTTAQPMLDADIKAGETELGEVMNIARTFGVSAVEGIKASGRFSLDVHASGPIKYPDQLEFNGTGSLREAAIETPYVTQPLRIGNANLQFTKESAEINGLTASLGHTNANGNLTVWNFTAPVVKFALAADTVNVAELEAMLAPAPPAKSNKVASVWSLVPRAEAAPVPSSSPTILDKTTGTGTISVGTIVNDEIVLTHATSNVQLDHGVVKLSPLTANMFGGVERGAVTVDMRQVPISYTVQSSLQKVDANKLLSSVSSIKQMLFGVLAANAQTSFSGTGADSIAKSLNGNLSLNLQSGKITAVDLLYEVVALVDSERTGVQKKPFTNVIHMSGDINMVNGFAQTQNLALVIDDATLTADGGVNLASQDLKLHLVATLSKSLSDKLRGNKVGKALNYALVNRNGELVIPVVVSGTMEKMKFTPDLKRMADLKLEMISPGLNTTVLGRLFHRKKKKKDGQTQDASAQQAAATPAEAKGLAPADGQKKKGMKAFFGGLFKKNSQAQAGTPQ